MKNNIKMLIVSLLIINIQSVNASDKYRLITDEPHQKIWLSTDELTSVIKLSHINDWDQKLEVHAYVKATNKAPITVYQKTILHEERSLIYYHTDNCTNNPKVPAENKLRIEAMNAFETCDPEYNKMPK